jgi:hypothetical protein
MKTIQEINQELKEVAAQIEKLAFDNYGVCSDREFADLLFAREEELMNLLGFSSNR